MIEDENTGVAAVVLAAGCSRRMAPANKLLQSLGGRPLVAWVVDSLLACRVASVLVVTGYQADAVRGVLGGRSVTFVHNPDYASGMASSLRAGVAAVSADVQAALICLGDMPWVGPTVVNRLIAAHQEERKRDGVGSIVVPMVGERRGNPVLWHRRHFSEFAALEGDVGARSLIERHAGAVVPVCFERGSAEGLAVTSDFDTFVAFSPSEGAAFDNNSR